MVSPLRIWQHPEPKGLWPALGGLAVVAHVGVIGLSLPYVARLVGGGSDSAAAVVPIELIIDTDTESTLVEAAAAGRGDNNSVSEQSKQRPDPAKAVSPASPVKRSPAEAAERPIDQTTIDEPSPVDEQTEQVNEELSDSDTPAKSEVPTEDASEIEDTQALTGQNETLDEVPPVEEKAETTPSEETPSNETGDLPSLGGQQLPSPGDASTSEGIDQVTALSFREYDPDAVPESMRQDRFVEIPPKPDRIAPIAERPQDLRCDEVGELPPMPLTYRVKIGRSGTIQEAAPWTGEVEVASPLNGPEAAVECLLQQSGWSFIPGFDNEGKVYPFSDGLLTFTIELQTD